MSTLNEKIAKSFMAMAEALETGQYGERGHGAPHLGRRGESVQFTA